MNQSVVVCSYWLHIDQLTAYFLCKVDGSGRTTVRDNLDNLMDIHFYNRTALANGMSSWFACTLSFGMSCMQTKWLHPTLVRQAMVGVVISVCWSRVIRGLVCVQLVSRKWLQQCVLQVCPTTHIHNALLARLCSRLCFCMVILCSNSFGWICQGVTAAPSFVCSCHWVLPLLIVGSRSIHLVCSRDDQVLGICNARHHATHFSGCPVLCWCCSANHRSSECCRCGCWSQNRLVWMASW